MADKDEPKVVTREEQMQERQRAAARESAESDAPQLDQAPPGGRYLLDDGETMVDANGKPLGKD